MADNVQWWGMSPGRSLLPNEGLGSEDIHILLAGGCDLRFILLTLVDAQRGLKEAVNAESGKLHFYVCENHIEVMARQLLLLAIVFDTNHELSVQERAALFLELLGNALVRPQTEAFLNDASKHLVRTVTDDDFLQSHLPMVDLSSLKFKERDDLEAIFKSWRTSSKVDIPTLWGNRVRGHLATRYDSRLGVFDWDFHMKLLDLTSDIAWPEYKEWRETGVAFQPLDSSYTEPNRSLVSNGYARQDGQRVPVKGYWGDIVTGPFLAYAEGAKDTSSGKTQGSVEQTKAGDAVWKAILSLMEVLHPSSPTRPEAESEEAQLDLSTPDQVSKDDSGMRSICDRMAIHFLRMDGIATLCRQSKFENLFNQAYFSNRMVHHLKADLSHVFAENSRLFTETVLYVLDLQQEKKEDYVERVISLAEGIHFTVSNASWAG